MRLPPFLLVALAVWPVASVRAQQPNLLILLADDVGVDAVRAYGEGADPPYTPNIDALAANGVLFRNAWSDPLCSPTRALIHTGRYALRTGVGSVVNFPGTGEPVMKLAETTLPELLDAKGSGYAHAAIGKWHLGNQSTGGVLSPNLAGWSYYAGQVIDGTNYFSWYRTVNGVTNRNTNYMTTQNVNDALEWILTAPEPWVCYVAFLSAHEPFHTPPPQLFTRNLQGLTVEQNPAEFYKAMVEAMDTEIGRLLSRMGSARVARTNVMFLGDNGTPYAATEPPFISLHSKGTCYEGGINVPLIVSGPDVGSPGREEPALVSLADLFPTAAELCGVNAEVPGVKIDGVSFARHLRAPGQPPSRSTVYAEVFWPFKRGQAAVRDARYKLYRNFELEPPQDELYDLVADPFEQTNLHNASMTPAQRAELIALGAAMDAIRDVTPTVTRYGTAECLGSNGRPSIGWSGLPELGKSYTLSLQQGAPSQLALLMVGLSNTHWGALGLPFPLSAIGGGPSCFIQASGEGQVPTTTDAAGQASVAITLPQLYTLIGAPLFHSWLVLDASAPNNPLGVTSSDGATARIGTTPGS